MNLKCGGGGEAVCGQRGRKFNNVKAGMHRPIYYSRYAGGRSFVFEWGGGGRPWDTSSPLIRARYASYGRYLCRDDKFNRRLKMRLEIRETRFLAHTSFFFFFSLPRIGKYTHSMILSRPSCLVHRHASISHRFSSLLLPNSTLARNLYFSEI